VKVSARFRAGITRYEPSDADDLTAFRLRTFGPQSRQVDAERIKWLFEGNPCVDPARPGLWVCRRNGEVVGQQAEIPFDLQLGGDQRRAAWAIDLMVEEAWRLRGVGPGLIATQFEEHSVVAGLNLSDKGFAAYQRTGWTDLGIVPVYIRPLDVRGALDVVPGPAALRRVAPVAGPLLRLADSGAGTVMRAAGLRLVEVERLDERVDAVWATAADHYPVIARRDLAAVGWRLDERPDRDRLRRYVLERHGRPVGYVVLRPTARFGKGVVVVVDYLAPPRWVAPMLLAAGAAARREGGAVLLAKTLNEQADRWLRAAGFLRRDRGNDPPIRLMVHYEDGADRSDGAAGGAGTDGNDGGDPRSARDLALLRDPANWFVTSADSDLEPATRVEPPEDQAP